MTPASAPDCDVATVGYGPVGALTGLLLADAGLSVVIVDRTEDVVPLPRAVGMDGESMRTFQRIGLDDSVAKVIQPEREVEEYCFTNSRRESLLAIALPSHGHNGWRDNAFFDQPELEALLREHVARSERIELRLGVEVVGLEQSEGEVALRLASDRGDETLRAQYAIGCDGASSFVRQTLGIEWESLGYDQDWLVVDVTADPDADLPLTVMQVCDPTRLTTYIPARDPNRRWEFRLVPGETREQMLRPETIRTLLDPWLPAEQYEIRRAAVYQFHAATAERLRVGRVFLAGDSAHQTPPFLGQGLNSGFRDAANLGWRLPLVFRGECDDRLLDGYAAERDPHARDLVDSAVGIGQLMETLAAREAGRPDPYADAERRAAPAGAERGSVVPPLRAGTLVEDQVTQGSPVGRLLTQPTVRRPNDPPVRLDALLGHDFSVVGRSARDLRLGDEAASLLARLGARILDLEGLEVVAGELDPLFASHPAVVVRPDRYVFGVVDEQWSLDRLVAQLGHQLALR